jgi:uncharacterized protein
MFTRYQLRTTDVARAAAFYDAVLGHRADGIIELPAAAAARGAPSHWLGTIACDAPAVTARFVAMGATVLGGNVLRDPRGVIVALADGPPSAHVAWHVLNTPDPAGAATAYADLFGWTFREHTISVGGRPVGTLADLRPGVHPHWLFHFPTPSLDASLDLVRAHHGEVFTTPTARVAMCHDPLGAAFGLIET